MYLVSLPPHTLILLSSCFLPPGLLPHQALTPIADALPTWKTVINTWPASLLIYSLLKAGGKPFQVHGPSLCVLSLQPCPHPPPPSLFHYPPTLVMSGCRCQQILQMTIGPSHRYSEIFKNQSMVILSRIGSSAPARLHSQY